MADEQNISAEQRKKRQDRMSIYIAVGLGIAVLALYMFAFTVDWASLWRNTEAN